MVATRRASLLRAPLRFCPPCRRARDALDARASRADVLALRRRRLRAREERRHQVERHRARARWCGGGRDAGDAPVRRRGSVPRRRVLGLRSRHERVAPDRDAELLRRRLGGRGQRRRGDTHLGGGQYGNYPLHGALILGGPYGFQVAVGADGWDLSLQQPKAMAGSRRSSSISSGSRRCARATLRRRGRIPRRRTRPRQPRRRFRNRSGPSSPTYPCPRGRSRSPRQRAAPALCLRRP